MKLLLLLLVSTTVHANEPWWKSAFPGSFETRVRISTIVEDESQEGDRPYYDNEHPALLDEPAEPQAYHWDNLYLENEGPEIIINPYEDEKVYWDEDEL